MPNDGKWNNQDESHADVRGSRSGLIIGHWSYYELVSEARAQNNR